MRVLALTAMAGLVCLGVPASSYAQSPAATPAVSLPGASPGVFPAEARVGFVDLGRVAQASRQGQALTSRIQEVRAKKTSEVEARGKEVAALESKLNEQSAVLNEAARVQLRRQFERAQVDFQRFTQDAQAEVQQVQRELEDAFLQKAFPVIAAVARKRRPSPSAWGDTRCASGVARA